MKKNKSISCSFFSLILFFMPLVAFAMETDKEVFQYDPLSTLLQDQNDLLLSVEDLPEELVREFNDEITRWLEQPTQSPSDGMIPGTNQTTQSPINLVNENLAPKQVISESNIAYITKIGQVKESCNDRKYTCSICGKIFRRGCGFTAHLKTHRSCNLPCNICGRILSSNGALTRHLKSHYPRYLCPFCRESFAHVEKYRTHLKKTHMNKFTDNLIY
jgi:hypothetical protein